MFLKKNSESNGIPAHNFNLETVSAREGKINRLESDLDS